MRSFVQYGGLGCGMLVLPLVITFLILKEDLGGRRSRHVISGVGRIAGNLEHGNDGVVELILDDSSLSSAADSNEVKRAVATTEKRCRFEASNRAVGEWKRLDKQCEQASTSTANASWADAHDHWCSGNPLRITSRLAHPPNPREFFERDDCDMGRLPKSEVLECMRRKKFIFVGDSTMMEIFAEAMLRVLPNRFHGRYDIVHQEPGENIQKDPNCVDRENFKDVHLGSSACYHLPVSMDTADDAQPAGMTDVYSFPVRKFKMDGIEFGYVRFKSANMEQNHGGINALSQDPFHTILQNSIKWGDVIIINNLLHSMGTKRILTHFDNSWEKADKHFHKLKEIFKNDLQNVALPMFRDWIQRGKQVLWWTGNRPSRTGTRPLLQVYYPMFTEAAREAILESNNRHTQKIGFVDTSPLSEAGGKNSTDFTDGLHFGIWAILPRHRSKSTLVAKTSLEFILNAACAI